MYDDFEIGAYDSELYYAKDYEGLLQLRENRLRALPNDSYAQHAWAEVLLLTKKYDKAIEFLTPLHKEEPDNEDVAFQILDALKGMYKGIDDYNWVKKPKITRLDKALVDKVIKKLNRKRKADRTLYEAYSFLELDGDYMDFDEQEFFDFLKKDKRIKLEGKFRYTALIEIVKI